jgi:hypothetical protein
MMNKYLVSFILLLSLGLFSKLAWTSSANQSQLKPFIATYTLLHKKDEVGTAERKLIQLDNGHWQFSYHTDLEWLIFSDKRTETSTLAIKDGTATPLAYEYQREGTGKDKHKKWQFFPELKKAKNLLKNQENDLQWHDGLQDKLSYHLQNRLNLKNNIKHYTYSVINRSGKVEVNRYQFEYAGEETLVLPFGVVKTVKLKREIPEKKKATYAWFAPELDFLMVKLYHQKGGLEQFEAQLNKLSFPEAKSHSDDKETN